MKSPRKNRLSKWLAMLLCVALAGVAVVVGALRGAVALRETREAKSAFSDRGRFVSVKDAELFYQERGPATGPVVVMLPGNMAWSENWKPVLRALGEKGYRALAVDLPPWGVSIPAPSASYTREAQAKRLTEWLRKLGIGRFVLVGHSFSGYATLTLAFGERENLAGLVLIDVALGLPHLEGSPPPPIPLWKRALFESPFVRRTVASALTFPLFSRRLLEPNLKDPAAATDARIRVYQEPFTVEGATERAADWIGRFVLEEEHGLTESGALASLSVPTLLIWGEEDTVTPLWQGQWLARTLPQARLAPLKAVGHIPQIEAPDAFEKLLLDYLREVAPVSQ